MQIDFFSTHLKGGAGNAASQFFNNLPNTFKKKFYYQNGNIENSIYNKRDINKSNNLKQKIINSLNARFFYYKKNKFNKNYPQDIEGFNLINNFRSTPYSFFGDLPDIINLHWIADWIDYPSFFKSIPNKTPIIWYLHDMNPYTGGCHYSYNCKLYTKNCYPCYLVDKNNNDKIRKNFTLKSSLLKDKNLHIVGNSEWSTQQAKKSQVFQNAKSFTTIYLGINTYTFTPNPKNLVINKSSKIKILFGSDNNQTKRKGFVYLIDSLNYVYSRFKDFELHTFGNDNLDINNLDYPIINHGKIINQHKLADLYSSSDIFVVPSLYESFGLTSIEAQACETPVVGFNTSGLKENIINNKTGLLANFNKSKDLGEKILYLINNPQTRLNMGINGRNHVIEKFSSEKQNLLYNDFIKSLL